MRSSMPVLRMVVTKDSNDVRLSQVRNTSVTNVKDMPEYRAPHIKVTICARTSAIKKREAKQHGSRYKSPEKTTRYTTYHP